MPPQTQPPQINPEPVPSYIQPLPIKRSSVLGRVSADLLVLVILAAAILELVIMTLCGMGSTADQVGLGCRSMDYFLNLGWVLGFLMLVLIGDMFGGYLKAIHRISMVLFAVLLVAIPFTMMHMDNIKKQKQREILRAQNFQEYNKEIEDLKSASLTSILNGTDGGAQKILDTSKITSCEIVSVSIVNSPITLNEKGERVFPTNEGADYAISFKVAMSSPRKEGNSEFLNYRLKSSELPTELANMLKRYGRIKMSGVLDSQDRLYIFPKEISAQCIVPENKFSTQYTSNVIVHNLVNKNEQISFSDYIKKYFVTDAESMISLVSSNVEMYAKAARPLVIDNYTLQTTTVYQAYNTDLEMVRQKIKEKDESTFECIVKNVTLSPYTDKSMVEVLDNNNTNWYHRFDPRSVGIKSDYSSYTYDPAVGYADKVAAFNKTVRARCGRIPYKPIYREIMDSAYFVISEAVVDQIQYGGKVLGLEAFIQAVLSEGLFK